VLLVGGLAGTAFVKWRTRRPSVVGVLLSVWCALFGIDPPWDWPGDAWDWVSGGAQDIWGAIKGAVKVLISAAVSAVEGTIDWIYSTLWSMIQDAWTGINNAINFVWDRFWAAVQEAWNAAQWAWSQAQWLVNQVEQGLQWALDQAIAGVNAIINGVRDLILYVWHTVVEPALGALHDLILELWHGVVEPALGALHDALAQVYCSVTHVIDQVVDKVGSILSFIDNVLNGVVELIQKCWSFLVFVAEHPFDWFTHLVNDIFSKSGSWLFDKIAGSVLTDGDTLTDTFSRWLE
jgi:phage-related protein